MAGREWSQPQHLFGTRSVLVVEVLLVQHFDGSDAAFAGLEQQQGVGAPVARGQLFAWGALMEATNRRDTIILDHLGFIPSKLYDSTSSRSKHLTGR